MTTNPTTPVALANGAIAGRVSRLVGFSIAETTGTVAAKVRFRNGTVSGAILAVVTLLAGESVRDWYGPQGVLVPAEVLYVEVVAGSVEGSTYVGV